MTDDISDSDKQLNFASTSLHTIWDWQSRPMFLLIFLSSFWSRLRLQCHSSRFFVARFLFLMICSRVCISYHKSKGGLLAVRPLVRTPMFFSHLRFGSSFATRHSMSSVKTSSMPDECSEHGWMDRERQTGNAILRCERNACTHVRQSTQFSPAHSVLSHQRPSELNLLLQQTANLARFMSISPSSRALEPYTAW